MVGVAALWCQALPFVRASLSWSNVGYTVQVKADRPKANDPSKTEKVTVPKVLLTDVSGAAPPGRLVALMGATGGT